MKYFYLLVILALFSCSSNQLYPPSYPIISNDRELSFYLNAYLEYLRVNRSPVEVLEGVDIEELKDKSILFENSITIYPVVFKKSETNSSMLLETLENFDKSLRSTPWPTPNIEVIEIDSELWSISNNEEKFRIIKDSIESSSFKSKY